MIGDKLEKIGIALKFYESFISFADTETNGIPK